MKKGRGVISSTLLPNLRSADGRTKPARRGQLPFDVKLLHSIERADEIEAETSYHREYADKRRLGSERFRLTEEDLKDIGSVEYVGRARTRFSSTDPDVGE